MSKSENLPELRFPGFKDEWEVRNISRLGKTINGLSNKTGDDFGSGEPYVQYNQVFGDSFIDFSECGEVYIGDDENQNALQLGDILFTTSSETPNEIGFASVIIREPEHPTYLNSFCFILRPFNMEKIRPNFSRYLFHSLIFRKSVSAIAQGITRYNISKKAFLKLKVSLPALAEQQKIAACLSSLDDVITAYQGKLETLKEHKKGLMQRLFPREGERVPELRFPGFKDAWEVKRLGEVVNVMTGNRNTQDKVDNGKYPFFVRSQTVEKINSFSFEGEAILTSGDGMVGKIYHYIIGKFDFHQRVYCLYDFKDNVEGKFIFYFFSERFYNRVMQLSAKNTVDSVRKSMITKMPILVPALAEQQKIAACLSSLDEVITACQGKLETLKEHKKGLMQKLFPKNEG